MARPLKEIDPAKVRMLARTLASVRSIAAQLKVSEDTLARRFKKEIEEGRAETELLLASKVIAQAQRGDKASQQLALARLGWADGPPPPSEFVFRVVYDGDDPEAGRARRRRPERGPKGGA